MNFDELQKQWNNQSIKGVEIDTTLDKLKKANLPIDRARSNMKKDFFFQPLSFLALFIYPYIFPVPEQYLSLIWWLIICISIIMCIPIGYLISFYKKSYTMDYSSLKSLNWFYYNYKFGIDLFRIYTYVTYLLVMLYVGVVFFLNLSKDMTTLLQSNPLFYIGVLFMALMFAAICYIIMHFWIRWLYQKPLDQIKQIIDEFD